MGQMHSEMALYFGAGDEDEVGPPGKSGSKVNKNTMHGLQDGTKEDAKEDVKVEGAKKGAKDRFYKDGSKDGARMAQHVRYRNAAS